MVLLLWLAIANPTPFFQAPTERPHTNPFPHTTRSIQVGRQIYLNHCTNCHDSKGKPVLPADSGAARPADLTRPKNWVHGMTDPEMFDTIMEGTEEMTGFKDKLRDNDVWYVIHFVRSLWPRKQP
jgi:mono/diheme cytochrome c family protein